MLQDSAAAAEPLPTLPSQGPAPGPALLTHDDPHPGAGGLKARVRAFLFGDEPAPRKIGRFTIREPLASGGMGTVFLAEDEELGRLMALKLVRYDRVSSEAQARLRREAQGLARVAHPNVVTIFEVGEHEGLLYLAMEYVEGLSLRRWLHAEARGWAQIVEVFEQAAAGLAAAHRAGLVHRDFKPDNVIVGADGRVRVVDFGLVSMGEDEAPAPLDDQAPVTELALTQTGALLGTPAYMAPEQFLGQTPTPASDQFAFFVALHEALADGRPFAGASVEELMRAVLEGDARSLQTPTIPAQLRAAVARGIAREPDRRFADMDAVLVELRRLREHDSRSWYRPLALVGGGVLLAGLVFGALARGPAPAGEEPTPASAPAAVATPADTNTDTAAAKAALAALLESDGDEARLQLARDYLADFAELGGVGRRLIAEAAVGEILWRRSCPSPRAGLCVTLIAGEDLQAPPDAPEVLRCETHDEIARRPRDEQAELALDHLRRATHLAASDPTLDDEAEQRAMSEALATATLLVVDAELEAYLDIRPPRGLDFAGSADHTKLSRDAFEAFYARKSEAAQRIVGDYRAVKDAGSPRATVLAAARTSLAYRDFADTLMTMPIAPSLGEAEPRQAYCAALHDQVDPVRALADETRDYCQSKAADAGLDAELCATNLSPALNARGSSR